jgi:hypothetical protein
MRTKAVYRYRSLILGLILAFPAVSSGRVVREYAAVVGIGVARQSSDTVIVLRRFVLDTEVSYLTVDPATLSTSIAGSKDIVYTGVSWQTIFDRFAAKPYIRALKRAAALGDSLRDAGIRNFSPSQQGINLTIDLCPSKKPLDRTLFTAVAAAFGTVAKPVPIAVGIAGFWLKSHEDDFLWLKNFADTSALSITWINHSFNHYVKNGIALDANYLLEKNTDLDAEVLWTEKALLRKGLRPSVFFRFPGLVSDSTVFMKIIGFGLIPVGSAAWVSRDQKARNGSIVLVHGNGNDSCGVRAFLDLLERERQQILEKQWGLFDLRESMLRQAGE